MYDDQRHYNALIREWTFKLDDHRYPINVRQTYLECLNGLRAAQDKEKLDRSLPPSIGCDGPLLGANEAPELE